MKTLQVNLDLHMDSTDEEIKPEKVMEMHALNAPTKSPNRKNKSFECKICGAYYKNKNTLGIHISFVHEGNKPFTCEYCKTAFPLKKDLDRHVSSVHEGKKPHTCKLCIYSCSKKGNLITHISSIHKCEKASNVNFATKIFNK